MNRDYIGVKQLIPNRRGQISAGAFPPASPLIRRKPPEEFEEMRTRNVWDFMPTISPWDPEPPANQPDAGQLFHALGVKVYLQPEGVPGARVAR